uniref:Cytochrome c oxidase subunit 3 n=1 Tax=Orthione mesoamericana TaxID=2480053 RepID=A0A8K1Y3I7_9CRUS|nr:cytochrome c oxidase subunit III [Orthione mesoamericana]
MTKLFVPSFTFVYHSPWPLTTAGGVFALLLGLVLKAHLHEAASKIIIIGLLTMVLSMAQWFRDVTREGTHQGNHTSVVQTGLKYGMVLFIASEVLFFFSFFWAFFHSSLSPTPELGLVWPPKGISVFNPFDIPLLNTIILLSSGATVTWAHHSVLEGDHSEAVAGMVMTVMLGAYFTGLQALEYVEAPFSIADSVYGSTFFVATGFHGLHVIIGSIFLMVMGVRLAKGHFSPTHHFGLEAAAWYWHFVDVVWLFLFVSIYWWGG